MHPVMTYTSCATSLKEQTGNIITFINFEEGDLLSKNHNDVESGDEYNDDSVMPPLLSKEEIGAMDSGYESDDEDMSTDMLENIPDGSHSHLDVK